MLIRDDIKLSVFFIIEIVAADHGKYCACLRVKYECRTIPDIVILQIGHFVVYDLFCFLLQLRVKGKVAFYCNLDKEDVISSPDCSTIYELPLIFAKQHFADRLQAKLHLKKRKPELKEWQHFVSLVKTKHEHSVKVAIIAKYIATGDYELTDSYASLVEALRHSAWHNRLNLELLFINAQHIEQKKADALKQLKSADAVIVPIGWGERGVEGKISAIQYAREHKVPYLGLCYGMQLAAIEFARHVVGLTDAHTTEVDAQTKHPIIHSIPFDAHYQRIKGEGASMRLGGYDCVLKPGTLAYSIYEKHDAFKDKRKRLVSERHRHRFELNNAFRAPLEKEGFVISGTSPDDFFVEMIELPRSVHPFFLATQAHPEYKSQPLTPHPIFVEFLRAAKKQ
jgi:CTP synthase